ncbi:hypothetical protein TrST_g13888 [Triparma strigata]|uniref:Fe2OG dioxygenase domain-containing protein n=1 Tax=Triparma strigata TaxID=1606541 RepID=A0A9W7C3C9_9STRA|nr:hypothetical protein TrST_g13888 [Triparma strigata]
MPSSPVPSLLLTSYCTLSTSPTTSLSCFESFVSELPNLRSGSHGYVGDDSSDTAKGYHTFGGMSEYNSEREGIIFSRGSLPSSSSPLFRSRCLELRRSAISLSRTILNSISAHLKLPEDYFESEFGDLEYNCQWHIKRYNSKEGVVLPVHTDPSLISILMHDFEEGEGCEGLEVLVEEEGGKVWREVEGGGWGKCNVLVGSVMERITGGFFKASRHRVRRSSSSGSPPPERVVATFFIRPSEKAVLRLPPSPLLEGKKVKEMEFGAWLRRTARNYERHKARAVEKVIKKEEKAKGVVKPASSSSEKSQKTKKNKKKNFSPLPPSVPNTPKIDSPVYSPCGSACQIIGDEITGQEKYLGGDCGSDGRIYAIPGCARQVLRIDCETGVTDLIGPVFEGDFKWLRSVKAVDGDGNEAIYGLPCHADSVLKIVPATGEVKTFGDLGGQMWKYHGGNLAEGRIWCIPQKAKRVLVINPQDDSISYVGGPFEGECKWYGGLPGKADGCIYGMPQCSHGVLKINPKTATVDIIGSFPEGGHKWHGGLVDANGDILAIPANADSCLKVCPSTGEIKVFGEGKVRTGKHRDDGKYKFLGGVLGVDGNVYFIPSDSDRVVQVNPKTEEVREVGPSLENEIYVENKWQNGFSAEDGSIYAVPLKGANVLCIRPHKLTESGEPEVSVIGGPYLGLNKWEGGVVGPDGACYCMPLGHRRVLRISPPGGVVLKATTGNTVGKRGEIVADMAVLRSSNHTTKYSKARKNDKGPVGEPLPPAALEQATFAYPHGLRSTITKMLKAGVGDIFEGDFEVLEDITLQGRGLMKKDKGKSQKTLTALVAADEEFLATFDAFVEEAIIPYLKRKLGGLENTLKFYVQRPPTVRIQPGPSSKSVRPHCDAEYGHQPGELNFWLPLTDPKATSTTLWVETEVEGGEYKALECGVGEVAAFWGTKLRHYVPCNESGRSRVSIDFRVGVEGYFDPEWSMKGTVDDHNRRVVEM